MVKKNEFECEWRFSFATVHPNAFRLDEYSGIQFVFNYVCTCARGLPLSTISISVRPPVRPSIHPSFIHPSFAHFVFPPPVGDSRTGPLLFADARVAQVEAAVMSTHGKRCAYGDRPGFGARNLHRPVPHCAHAQRVERRWSRCMVGCHHGPPLALRACVVRVSLSTHSTPLPEPLTVYQTRSSVAPQRQTWRPLCVAHVPTR